MLLTGIDQEFIYLFDPYYCEEEFENEKIHLIQDKPFTMNRKIAIDIVNGNGNEDYALGDFDKRECVLMYNKAVKTTMDSIEYMI